MTSVEDNPEIDQVRLAKALSDATAWGGMSSTQSIAKSDLLTYLATRLWQRETPVGFVGDSLDYLLTVIDEMTQKLEPVEERDAFRADCGFTFADEGARDRRRKALQDSMDAKHVFSVSTIGRRSDKASAELSRRLAFRVALQDAPTQPPEEGEMSFKVLQATTCHIINKDRLVESARYTWLLKGTGSGDDPILQIHTQYFTDSRNDILTVVPHFGAILGVQGRSIGGSSVTTDLHLGRRLKPGELHLVSYEVRVSSSKPIAKTIFVVPIYGVESQFISVQFHPTAKPSGMWRFAALNYGNALDPAHAKQTEIGLNSDPVFTEQWQDLAPSLSYGLHWDW